MSDSFTDFLDPSEPDSEVSSLWDDDDSQLRIVTDAIKGPPMSPHFETKEKLQKRSQDRLKKLESQRLKGARILNALRKARILTGSFFWNVLVKVAPSKYKRWLLRATRPSVIEYDMSREAQIRRRDQSCTHAYPVGTQRFSRSKE